MKLYRKLITTYHEIWEKIAQDYDSRRSYTKYDVIEDRFLLYGEDIKNNTYDVFYPNNNGGRMPTIFMIHGGGYITGTKEGSVKICQELAKRGFLVFNIEYTKCDKEEKKYLPYQVYEFFKFYKHITTSSEYSDLIDFNNCYMAGNSAGGHIAALIANIQTNPELKMEYNLSGGPLVKGVILLSPSLGAYKFGGLFPKELYHTILFGQDNNRSHLSKLTHNLEITTEAFPPTIMFSTKGDWVVGAHKTCFLNLAKELNLSVEHYDICTGYKLFHSSMVEHADKYQLCLYKIENFIRKGKHKHFVKGVISEKLYEKTEDYYAKLEESKHENLENSNENKTSYELESLDYSQSSAV